MAEDEILGAVSGQVGQFETVTQLYGFITFSSNCIWTNIDCRNNWNCNCLSEDFHIGQKSQKFSYTRPHLSRFVRVAILPFFAIALISSTNAYIQTFELFA